MRQRKSSKPPLNTPTQLFTLFSTDGTRFATITPSQDMYPARLVPTLRNSIANREKGCKRAPVSQIFPDEQRFAISHVRSRL